MWHKLYHFIWGIWRFHTSKDFEAMKAGKSAIWPKSSPNLNSCYIKISHRGTSLYWLWLHGSKVCLLYCKVMFTFAAMPDLRAKMSALASRQTAQQYYLVLGNGPYIMKQAAPEKTMQLRGLIKGSNWSLGHYLFERYDFWKFWPPIAQIPGGRVAKKAQP